MAIRITNGRQRKCRNTRERTGKNVVLTTKQGRKVEIDRGRFSTNNMWSEKLWVFYNEFGPMGAVWGKSMDEALDELVDQDLAGGILMTEETAKELEDEGQEVEHAGNFGEPINTDYLQADEIKLDPHRDAALLAELKQAEEDGADFLSDLDEGRKGNKRKANIGSKVVRGGKAKAVKNLGWLLQHWKDVESFEVTEGGKFGSSDVVLRAWLHTVDDHGIKTRYPDRGPTSGDYYETDFASRSVLADFLQRPVFEGLPIKWLGKSMKVGPALKEFGYIKKSNPRSAPDKYGDRTGYHMSLSYGQLPPKAKFVEIWDDEMGSRSYNWDLKNRDSDVMHAVKDEFQEKYPALKGVTDSGIRDADAAWVLLHALKKYHEEPGEPEDSEDMAAEEIEEWQNEWAEEAGNLASGILYTLGIEWV